MSHKTGSLETPSELTPLIPGGSGKGAKEYLEERSPNHSSTHRRNSTSKSVAIGKGLGHKEGAVYSVFGSSDVSLRLQNTGTVARDHLALERTFLAYVRTSLSIASAGVALAQIMSIAEFYSGETHPSKYKRQVEAWARPLGASAVIIAIFVLCIGVARYFAVQHALVGGRFPVSRIGIGLMSALFGSLIIATFAVLMNGHVSALLWFP